MQNTPKVAFQKSLKELYESTGLKYLPSIYEIRARVSSDLGPHPRKSDLIISGLSNPIIHAVKAKYQLKSKNNQATQIFLNSLIYIKYIVDGTKKYTPKTGEKKRNKTNNR